MISFVRKTLVMQLRAGATDRFPVLAHLCYDAEDPFAITAVFSHDGRVLARWRLDREMPADGLRGPVGVGDARFRPVATGQWEELRMEFLGDARPSPRSWPGDDECRAVPVRQLLGRTPPLRDSRRPAPLTVCAAHRAASERDVWRCRAHSGSANQHSRYHRTTAATR
ncbi:SsgA family sporulation/cell division regulator [Streptomyces sp. NPDC002928]|uniref:SsgA family sporulation/cell division regulator n=1 Tax=Streptomyces sp. NPDC002928 TaxID=3154440 RepID=UPI0033A931D7